VRHWRITGNSNVVIKTGSTYISDSVTDITAIPTANLGFSTTPKAKKLIPGDCDVDRQPEMTIWPWKPEILTSLELWQTGWKFKRQIWGFRPRPAQRNWPRVITTTTDNRKLQYGRFARQPRNLWQSVVVAIILANPLSTSTSSKIPNLARVFRRCLSQFQRCNYFRFGATSTFPVVGQCCTVNIISHLYMVLYPSVVGILTVPFVA